MANNYTFLDSNGSVQTAASSIVSSAHQPIIQIGSVLSGVPIITSGALSVAGTVSINPASVSGTVGSSVIGTVPVVQSGAWSQSVVGTLGASVIGTVPVVQSGAWTQSVVGTVGASQSGAWTTSIVGTVGATQSGAWTTSIVGTPNIGSIIGAITPYAQSGSFVYGVSSVLTGTTATSILAAPGANLRNYITTIKVINAAAAGVIVDIKDSGANVLDTGYAAASGGGWSTAFPVPVKQTNTNASVDAVPRSQASVLVQITGYVAA